MVDGGLEPFQSAELEAGNFFGAPPLEGPRLAVGRAPRSRPPAITLGSRQAWSRGRRSTRWRRRDRLSGDGDQRATVGGDDRGHRPGRFRAKDCELTSKSALFEPDTRAQSPLHHRRPGPFRCSAVREQADDGATGPTNHRKPGPIGSCRRQGKPGCKVTGRDVPEKIAVSEGDVADVDMLSFQRHRINKKSALGEVFSCQHDDPVVLQHLQIDSQAIGDSCPIESHRRRGGLPALGCLDRPGRRSRNVLDPTVHRC